MNGKKVLLIDNDPEFLLLTSLALKKAGAQVFTAYNGKEGISKASIYRPSLILLDVMMPGMSGFEVCKKIRQFSLTPIIMITALNQEHDMIQGLNAGADGFLSKPFNWDVLLSRARVVMRRNEQSNNHQAVSDYNDGYLKIDVDKHRVQIEDRQVKLTPVEFRLLIYLLRNADRVLTFDEILANVWGSQYHGNNDYVHVYTSQLRGKIEKNTKNPRYILSIHGVGYMFEKQQSVWASSDEYEKVLISERQVAGNLKN